MKFALALLKFAKISINIINKYVYFKCNMPFVKSNPILTLQQLLVVPERGAPVLHIGQAGRVPPQPGGSRLRKGGSLHPQRHQQRYKVQGEDGTHVHVPKFFVAHFCG